MNNHLFIFRSQRPDFHDFYVFWENRENKCCTKNRILAQKFVRLIALQKSNLGTKNRENRWDTELEFLHEKCVESNDDEYASERPLYCEVNVNKTNF